MSPRWRRVGSLWRRRNTDEQEVPGSSTGEPDLRWGAESLLDAGIFDKDFYEAQCGLDFSDEMSAALHFVSHNDGTMSPHPLLELATIPVRQAANLANGDIRKLLVFLRSRGSTVPLSSLFDPRLVTLPAGQSAKSHRAGVLGLWLEAADADTPLPTARPLSWGVARERVIADARESYANTDLLAPRTTDVWDHEADQEWRHAWNERRPPAPGDLPLVSVIMPARNRASIIGRAVRSLQAQTLGDWELLVIDDGSTDDTAAVVRGLAAEDSRIRLLTQEWQGVSAARNAGLAAARGRFLAFLDTDNEWLPDFLHLMVTAMVDRDLPAAICAVAKHRDDGTTSYLAFQGAREHLLIKNHVDMNALLVDTDVARATGGFDPAIRRWVDHDFALKVSRLATITLLPFIGVDYDDDFADDNRITTSESDAWQYVVLNNAWCDFDSVDAAIDQRVAGRVSVLIPNYSNATMVVKAVASLLDHSGGHDLEVIVVDNGSSPAVDLGLRTAWQDEPRVTHLRLPRNLNFAGGSNYALARSTGELVVFLNNDTQVRPGWLEPLLEALEDPQVVAAQPLLVYADDSIQTAGTVFPVAGMPGAHFLVGQPPEDAMRMQDRTFHALTAACLAMRATDAIALRGFDPIYRNGMEDIDLCLRATAAHPGGRLVVVPESRVTHHESKTPGRGRHLVENRTLFMDRWGKHLPEPELDRWKAEGLALTDVTDDGLVVPVPRFTVVRDPDDHAGLRWGVHIAAIPGAPGDLWGDTHFASALVDAFAQRGHRAGTYRHSAHDNSSRALDDVSLVVRGLDRVEPWPGAVNVLWVISHPELVTAEELREFDLVYVASEQWARTAASMSGREVHYLPQATNIHRLAGPDSPLGDGSEPLFVGNTHAKRPRTIVLDAIAHDVPVAIHGPGWQHVVPAERVASTYVDNRDLSRLYRAHGLVLNDHWADMAQLGFMNNRLYDAVAAGARVVTDFVEGLEHFEGAVQAYRTPDELAELCSPTGRSRFPDDDAMAAIAAHIAQVDSFEARADRLIADVTAVLACQDPPGGARA